MKCYYCKVYNDTDKIFAVLVTQQERYRLCYCILQRYLFCNYIIEGLCIKFQDFEENLKYLLTFENLLLSVFTSFAQPYSFSSEHIYFQFP